MGQGWTNLEYSFCAMGAHRWYNATFGYSSYSKAVESYGGKPKIFLSDHLQKNWCGNPGHTDWPYRNSNHLDGAKAAGGNVMMGGGEATWYEAAKWRATSCSYWPGVSDAWSQMRGSNTAWPLTWIGPRPQHMDA